MQRRLNLFRKAMVVSIFIILANGCASSSPELVQPPATSHMQSAVGTPDEMSPLAPPEARNIRKVGNQWRCDVNGQVKVYNAATGRWEPQP